ncbi:tyrosine-type recombinase/integrase [Aliiglaciecola sp. LCG003]|uniref:tyrosine-type recombinase/integrase n=1 Tax=Aliiglaciecola sp. LCG003 TaxID=3053655 RepID=UPI0025726516|nr:tyrosine-type recombinase/integrase [Aliiglaciecola sp. LCG003]WJG07952.1 tyrosine-type recombinase/integrase [Aliiglaciecola sp. LCG003]
MSLTIEAALSLYYQECIAREQSPRTVEGKRSTLNQFLNFCHSNGIITLNAVALAHLRGYQHFLIEYRTKQGKPLDVATRRNKLVAIREFLRRMFLMDHIDVNPADKFEVPKRPKRLPSGILTEDEIAAIFKQTALHGENGLRDKAILELYYASGMRRAELSKLTLNDVDVNKNLVRINDGKGHKDRVVPIASRTAKLLLEYANTARKNNATFQSGEWLFLNNRSQQFSPKQLSSLVRKYVIRAGVNRKGACNLYRHTAATQMLENGADIRVIQEQLGHADLSTTQVYTKVSNKLLVDTYHRTHPAAIE